MGNELDLGTMFAALQYYNIIRISWFPRMFSGWANIINASREFRFDVQYVGTSAECSERLNELFAVSCLEVGLLKRSDTARLKSVLLIGLSEMMHNSPSM